MGYFQGAGRNHKASFTLLAKHIKDKNTARIEPIPSSIFVVGKRKYAIYPELMSHLVQIELYDPCPCNLSIESVMTMHIVCELKRAAKGKDI